MKRTRTPTPTAPAPAPASGAIAAPGGGAGNAHAIEQTARRGSSTDVGIGGAHGQAGATRGVYHRPDDISELTPAHVHEHRRELNIPDHPDGEEDYFNEFIAHQATGQRGRRSELPGEMAKLEEREFSSLTESEQQDLTRYHEERDLLQSWGYNPDVDESQEVYNPETGLYAVRFDPNEEGLAQGRHSITSFRGTQVEEGTGEDRDSGHGFLLDLRDDFASSEVGRNQYDSNREEIADLIAGGTEDGTVTGHSLGGFLAQRAAVDNADHLADVVTFQSGGLDREHAEAFEENRGDISVRHHSADNDLVHLAGEQRLEGETFHHHSSDYSQHHTSTLMFGTDDGANGNAQVMPHTGQIDQGRTEGWDPTNRRLIEGGRSVLGSAWQAVDFGYNTASSVMRGGDQAGRHVMEHAANAGEDVMGALGASASDIQESGGDALSSLSHGDVGDAAGSVLGGAMNVADNLTQAELRLADEAVRGVQDVGGDVADTVGDVGRDAVFRGGNILDHAGVMARVAGEEALDQGRSAARTTRSALSRAGRWASENWGSWLN